MLVLVHEPSPAVPWFDAAAHEHASAHGRQVKRFLPGPAATRAPAAPAGSNGLPRGARAARGSACYDSDHTLASRAAGTLGGEEGEAPA